LLRMSGVMRASRRTVRLRRPPAIALFYQRLF
jgi:hypothetical protein